MGLPVTIVIGFLGSGKSTLINEILKNIHPEDAKVAVLVSEFGDINIDSDVLNIDIDLNLINYKSSYKNIDDELIDKVYRVLERKERIDYLIVETTGLADPLPIALTFFGTELRDLTRLDSIITVVDAEKYRLDVFSSEAFLKQIAYSDIILLNKTDLVDEADLQELERKILEFKEGARIIRTDHCQVPLSLILNVGLFESDKYFDGADEHGYDYGYYHHDSEYLKNYDFTSVFFQSDKPFDVHKFENFLNNQLPANVFRAKGIMWFSDSDLRHIFCLCGPRYNLNSDEWKGKPKNQLLLIGQNLACETLLEQLENCLC
ncbi:CobW family GTP-binding protein [Fischerella sp. PCC 9605]|uniref:CobW family GTP-binding protein n=1 Tax=Fischerella sp. PCC 9605 TaxID=1173024 RepID=UPI0018CC0ADE|nr:GTP-binding protein [Fischerella sp. PCC 9605]